MKAAAKRKDFKPVPLKATLDVHGNAKTEVITSNNVVGLLPGTARPDETVIYMGHWDHLGIGQPDAQRRPHLQWRDRQRHRASPM